MYNEATRVETDFRVIKGISERPISGASIEIECIGHDFSGYHKTGSDGRLTIKHRYTGWHNMYVRIPGVDNKTCFKVHIGPYDTITIKVYENGYMEYEIQC